MKATKFFLIGAFALVLAGCVGRVADVGVETGGAQATIWQSQVELATYAPNAENKEAIKALCDSLADSKRERNAGWEFVKGVGGLALRTVGVVATAAGYPVAGAIDLVVDTVGEAENVVGEVNKANAAVITSNTEKCASVGVDIE